MQGSELQGFQRRFSKSRCLVSAAVAKERRPKSSSGVLKPFPVRFSNLVDLVPVNEVYPEVPCRPSTKMQATEQVSIQVPKVSKQKVPSTQNSEPFEKFNKGFPRFAKFEKSGFQACPELQRLLRRFPSAQG